MYTNSPNWFATLVHSKIVQVFWNKYVPIQTSEVLLKASNIMLIQSSLKVYNLARIIC